MKKLSVAIIGCGSIYQSHADAIMASTNATLVALVDIDKEKVQSAALKNNCDFYIDYRKMLKDEKIDVVHICTPHYLHSSMAIDAMKAGKHVLVEKPIGINVDQAELMIEQSRIRNKGLCISFQNRYNHTSIKAKEILDAGVLGKIRAIKGIVTWYRNEEYYTQSGWKGKWASEGGGVLINQSIHTLDLMQWFGGDIQAIKGHVDTRVLNDVIEVEDTAEATIYFKNGARGLFYATNCYTSNSPVEIEIHCVKGFLTIRDGELIISQDGKKECLICDRTSTGEKSYWGRGHSNLVEHFYQSIIQQTRDYVTAEEGIKAIKMIEAIYQSSLKNKKITIKELS